MSVITSESRVAGHTLDEGSEHRTDTDTGTSQANGRHASTLDLGSSHHGGGGRLGNDATGLHGIAGEAGGKLAAGAVEDQAIVQGGLTGLTDDGALDTSGSCCS